MVGRLLVAAAATAAVVVLVLGVMSQGLSIYPILQLGID